MAIQHGAWLVSKLQRGHVFPPKINACILCLCILCRTGRSFIRSFSRLSYNVRRLRTGVNGCSKMRCVLAKSHLILDEPFIQKVCIIFKMRLIFPRINGLLSSYMPQILLQIQICSTLNLSTSLPENVPIVLSRTLLCASTRFYYGTFAINTWIMSNYL